MALPTPVREWPCCGCARAPAAGCRPGRRSGVATRSCTAGAAPCRGRASLILAACSSSTTARWVVVPRSLRAEIELAGLGVLGLSIRPCSVVRPVRDGPRRCGHAPTTVIWRERRRRIERHNGIEELVDGQDAGGGQQQRMAIRARPWRRSGAETPPAPGLLSTITRWPSAA